jgi:hypothetical protein
LLFVLELACLISRPCLISCGILKAEITKIVNEYNLNVDLHFLDIRFHSDPNLLMNELSKVIEDRLKITKNIVLLYGDVCAGFNNEMEKLVNRYGIRKVNAINCIDCLLGGNGKILEIDPEHEFFYLNPSWLNWCNSDSFKRLSKKEARKACSMLKGVFLLDTLGDLDDYKDDIVKFCEYTGLPILERRNIGLNKLKKLILEKI